MLDAIFLLNVYVRHFKLSLCMKCDRIDFPCLYVCVFFLNL